MMPIGSDLSSASAALALTVCRGAIQCCAQLKLHVPYVDTAAFRGNREIVCLNYITRNFHNPHENRAECLAEVSLR
jgi:hypothetical protein